MRCSQNRINAPVFLRLKCLDLLLAVHDQTHGNRLHTSGRQSALDLLPKERAELIADQTIQDAPCLLRIHQINVDLVRIRHARLHAGLGDLVERHAVIRIHVQVQHLCQMPRNRFSLAVRVRCKVNGIAFLRPLLEILDDVLLALHVEIVRCKTVFYIDSELGFRQIAHMSHGRNNLKAGTQIFLYGFRLGRRLHNH